MKTFDIKQIKKIIDNLKITKKDLPCYGITCAKFAINFFDPKTEQKNYIKVYKYLYDKFAKIETITN